jgi:flagella basal body P-ring formation protein FlgA
MPWHGHKFIPSRPVVLCTLALLTAGVPGASQAESTWTVDLPAAVTLPARPVTLADLVGAPVPSLAGQTVLAAAGRPGEQRLITRRLVLRRLVETQLAEGVRFTGATSCRVTFAGRQVTTTAVAERVAELLAAWLPAGSDEAPPSWCEVTLPEAALTVATDWSVELIRPRPLQPGRNLLGVMLVDGQRSTRLNATVICHSFGQVPRALREIAAGTALTPDHFQWEWTDLAQVPHGVVCGQEAVNGQSARRKVAADALLRQADLRETPLVRRGQMIDLRLCRLGVTVVVRATARQDGCRGKIITVRNELNGELLTGRVAGPGLVEWGR